MKMQMPISLKGETRVYGQTDYPVLLRFSLAFNSILPAKASWPSQINPHPSRASHHLHPPPPPSLPPPGGARSRRARRQFGMLSATSKVCPHQGSLSSDSTPSAHLPPALCHGHLHSLWVMAVFLLFLNSCN